MHVGVETEHATENRPGQFVADRIDLYNLGRSLLNSFLFLSILKKY